MKRYVKFAMLLGMAVSTGSANASIQDDIISLGDAMQSAYLRDRGDIKGVELNIENKLGGLFGHQNYCQSRRAGARWRHLSRRYNAVIEAVPTGDAQKIFEAAKSFNELVNANHMYHTCWNYMVSHAKVLSGGGDKAAKIVDLGNQSGYR